MSTRLARQLQSLHGTVRTVGNVDVAPLVIQAHAARFQDGGDRQSFSQCGKPPTKIVGLCLPRT